MIGLVLTSGAWTLRPAHATTITVTSPNDMGPGSLRQAIADAKPGDTITFAPDVAAMFQGVLTVRNALAVDKELIIEGPGANALTITANAGSNSDSTVFTVLKTGF